VLRRGLLLLASGVVVAACAAGGADDPAAALADRVQDVLASADGGASVVQRLSQFGVSVTADELADGSLLCPRVTDPAAGDEATCKVTVGDQEYEIDVEFESDGSIKLVDAEVAP
jgi:hypothetical protein